MLWHGWFSGPVLLKALPLNGQEGRRGAVGSVRILECNLNEIERLEGDGYHRRFCLAASWLGGAGSANRQDPALQAKNIGYALSAVRTAGAPGCSRFLFQALRRSTGSAILP